MTRVVMALFIVAAVVVVGASGCSDDDRRNTDSFGGDSDTDTDSDSDGDGPTGPIPQDCSDCVGVGTTMENMLCAFDICDESGAGDSLTPGAGSRWELAQQPSVAMRDTAVFGIVINGGANGARIRVSIGGVHEASVNSGTIAKGDTLMAEGASFELADAATTVGARVLGYALEADTSGRATILFNGWGFGLFAAS